MSNREDELPKPTYWPMFFALGTTVVAWGLITSWVVSAVGALVLLVSITGWVKEIS
jgi:hypothetical protein